MYLLSADTVPRTDTECLQSVEQIALLPGCLLIVKETSGIKSPGVNPVLLTVVHGPLLDIDDCLRIKRSVGIPLLSGKWLG